MLYLVGIEMSCIESVQALRVQPVQTQFRLRYSPNPGSLSCRPRQLGVHNIPQFALCHSAPACRTKCTTSTGLFRYYMIIAMWTCSWDECSKPAVLRQGSCSLCDKHLCRVHLGAAYHKCPDPEVCCRSLIW